MLGCLHSLLAASEKVSFLLFTGKPVLRHFSIAIPWCTSHLQRQHGWLEQVRESGVSLGYATAGGLTDTSSQPLCPLRPAGPSVCVHVDGGKSPSDRITPSRFETTGTLNSVSLSAAAMLHSPVKGRLGICMHPGVVFAACFPTAPLRL